VDIDGLHSDSQKDTLAARGRQYEPSSPHLAPHHPAARIQRQAVTPVALKQNTAVGLPTTRTLLMLSISYGSDAMADRQFAISGKWALAADRLQWMVQRQYLHKGEIKWQSVSFVASRMARQRPHA